MRQLLTCLSILAFPLAVFSQTTPTDLDEVQPGRFDQGKMWTFENPPVQYFEEAYGFRPSDEWLADVRQSALRFASWCSASFVSENGLIMTNHHCSRSITGSVMREGENFDDNGFYATTQEEERRVPDLYVDQLVMLADVTEAVKSQSGVAPDSALAAVQKEFAQKDDWKDLEIETRTFYSGGRYSLYGFKRYTDIRLVLYPELALGFFGGDPDNFTYPRYSLDFTFFRAYDEAGNPLRPAHYFAFDAAGAQEGEAVFVIGNPGSTGRYKTMAQLHYQRDVSAPALLSFLRNRTKIYMEAAERTTDVYAKDSLRNLAFSLSNGEKAYEGRLDGLNDPYLMAKKQKKEDALREQVTEEDDPWNELEANAEEETQYFAEAFFLSPSPTRGKIIQLLPKVYDYRIALEQDEEEAAAAQRQDIQQILSTLDPQLETDMFAAVLEELDEHSRQDYARQLLDGTDPKARAESIMEESLLLKDSAKFFKRKPKKLAKDPLVSLANELVPRFREAQAKMGQLGQQDKAREEKIANLQYQVDGLSSPPDATFSLRIADGTVRGYEYNGTVAPPHTTYFGLYDRYYSHDKEFPWDLPDRWKNPPMDLLRAPLNFVSTADIIGGNSGSPVINQNAEVVGLVFDGNIESLPGYFIYDSDFNRTVSVHAGGIVAALKYIYKADRLLPELNAD
ncbi:MAG: S46 family peptidase [Tunicatimonas sp.]